MSTGRPTRSDTNQVVQSQKMSKDWKFLIKEVDRLHYLCSKNKGGDQLPSNHAADLCLCFAYVKSRFSHDVAHLRRTNKNDLLISVESGGVTISLQKLPVTRDHTCVF